MTISSTCLEESYMDFRFLSKIAFHDVTRHLSRDRSCHWQLRVLHTLRTRSQLTLRQLKDIAHYLSDLDKIMMLYFYSCYNLNY